MKQLKPREVKHLAQGHTAPAEQTVLEPWLAPPTLGPHLVPTHPGSSSLGFSSRDGSLSAPASRSSELESSATVSSFRLAFLLRSFFFLPMEATCGAMGSGSLAVPSCESEGKPDRPPQGMGDVHRRGGTCSCGEDQGWDSGTVGLQVRRAALLAWHPEPCQSLQAHWGQNRPGGRTGGAAEARPCTCCWPLSSLGDNVASAPGTA